MTVRVYGDKGSITWRQMEPNSLLVRWFDKPMQIYRTATTFNEMGSVGLVNSRLPAGHPEGFIEAFANVYRNFAAHINATLEGRDQDSSLDYPGIEEGVRGMKFLEAAVDSSSGNSVWKTL